MALPGADAISLIRDVIDVLKQDTVPDEQIFHLLTALSRHANDSATERLTAAEAGSLLDELQRFRPHTSAEDFKMVFRYLDLQTLHDLWNG